MMIELDEHRRRLIADALRNDYNRSVAAIVRFRALTQGMDPTQPRSANGKPVGEIEAGYLAERAARAHVLLAFEADAPAALAAHAAEIAESLRRALCHIEILSRRSAAREPAAGLPWLLRRCAELRRLIASLPS